MKLYSGPVSLFTAKVRIALAEKAIAYDRIEVGWSPESRYLPHHPDVDALNPKGQVPILVDGETVIYDSTVILEYLEDRFPTPALYPNEPRAKAECRQLEAWADETLFLPVWDLIEEAFYPKGPEARDTTRLDQAKQALAAHHAELDKRLSGKDWLCGDFSVADLTTMIFIGAAATMGAPPAPEHAHLAGWVARCGARASVRDEMAGMMAATQKARGA